LTYWTLAASHPDGTVIPISNHWTVERAETWAERCRNRRDLRGKWQIAVAGRLGFTWELHEMPGKPSGSREAAAERQHIAKHGWTPVGNGRGLPDRLYLDKRGKPVWVEIKPRKRN